MKNKLNFSERLKILFERESATFMNNIISDTSINNDSVLSEIAAAGPLYGLKYLRLVYLFLIHVLKGQKLQLKYHTYQCSRDYLKIH